MAQAVGLNRDSRLVVLALVLMGKRGTAHKRKDDKLKPRLIKRLNYAIAEASSTLQKVKTEELRVDLENKTKKQETKLETTLPVITYANKEHKHKSEHFL